MAAAAVAPVIASQSAPGYGIHVRAACELGDASASRVLADLSCESAMSCWGEPEALTLLDAADNVAVATAPGELLYVDANNTVLPEPPMQGTIRAIWAAAVEAPPAPRRLQLAINGIAVTAPFETAVDCAALPAAAVKRLGAD
ncbi:MAG TPA: hypothetical protein VIT90_08160 [Lysobacter sp.]